MAEKLTGNVILVTGASSGIGRATSIMAASQGASVILLGRNKERLTQTAEQIADSLIIEADLNDFLSFHEVAEKVFQWRGRLDGFAYCAGLGGRARLRDTTPEMMHYLMRINCFAFVELLRSLAKKKKKAQLLKVAVISSLASLGRDKYMTAYGASKAALECAAKSLALELHPRHILINIIRSAFVRTPMVVGEAADPTGDFLERLEESGYQPLGIIPPEEVARLAIYVLGPDISFSTGAVFSINAGAPC